MRNLRTSRRSSRSRDGVRSSRTLGTMFAPDTHMVDVTQEWTATLASPSSEAPCSGVRSLGDRTPGDRYRIVGLLDEGGMSSVYSAIRLDDEMPVVVKVLSPELAAHSFHRERFLAEAALVARVNHPHVVAYLDSGTTDSGEPCLVFERLRGETLLDRLRRGPLHRSDVATIVAQLADALTAAHDAQVVHRDVKPGNVFLTHDENGRLHAKLIDFGVSKDSSPEWSHDEGDVLIGTPGYMSPEQASGANQLVDGRSDQFSLALLAYEMVTGIHPFSAADLRSTLQRVKTHHPAPPSHIAPGVSPEMDRVLARGMAKECERRFPDVQAFALAFASAARRPAAESTSTSWFEAVVRLCSSRHEGPTRREGVALDPTLPSVVPPSRVRAGCELRRAAAQ